MSKATGDRHVYRAPEGFGEQWETNEEAIRAHNVRVLREWGDEAPAPAYVTDPFGVDVRFVGFADAGGEVPVGLSRSQERDWLIPRRGKAGRGFAEILSALNAGPKRGAVYERLGIPGRVVIENPDRRAWGTHLHCPVAPQKVGGVWVLVCTAEIPESERAAAGLERMPLSEYYALVESAENAQP